MTGRYLEVTDEGKVTLCLQVSCDGNLAGFSEWWFCCSLWTLYMEGKAKFQLQKFDKRSNFFSIQA